MMKNFIFFYIGFWNKFINHEQKTMESDNESGFLYPYMFCFILGISLFCFMIFILKFCNQDNYSRYLVYALEFTILFSIGWVEMENRIRYKRESRSHWLLKKFPSTKTKTLSTSNNKQFIYTYFYYIFIRKRYLNLLIWFQLR